MDKNDPRVDGEYILTRLRINSTLLGKTHQNCSNFSLCSPCFLWVSSFAVLFVIKNIFCN